MRIGGVAEFSDAEHHPASPDKFLDIFEAIQEAILGRAHPSDAGSGDFVLIAGRKRCYKRNPALDTRQLVLREARQSA